MNSNIVLDRKRKKRRRQRNRKLMVSITLVLVLTIMFWRCAVAGREQKVVEGVWVYDDYTKYEFDGKRNGCMYLDYMEYEYTYNVSGNMLKLNFREENVHDCVYQFKVQEDVLELTGREGTTGGTYSLIKK